MRLAGRITRLERELESRPAPDQLSFVTAVPVGDPWAEGRGVGLYRAETPGSTSGILVFDPAEGEPVLPDDVLLPWGKMLVLGPDEVPLPTDDEVDDPD